jgi:orotidine-5'-phosphate decarboxylase
MAHGADAYSRLAIALDFSSRAVASAFIQRIGAPSVVYKIGLELLFADGLALAAELIAAKQQVFIDAKLLDIGHTVERATARVAEMGAAYLSVHASDRKTLAAAARGSGGSELKVLGVTVLTSFSAEDVAEHGIHETPEALALRRAGMAHDEGLDGVIASAHEAASIKHAFGAEFLAVTPGIRLSGGDLGDQSRVATPAAAIRAGADLLVVGRPITQATDPKAALNTILADIAQALR